MGKEPKQLDSKWKQDYKNDVVYLHVISRSMAGSIVNLSPFALKLETWLRINKIPFEVISSKIYDKREDFDFDEVNRCFWMVTFQVVPLYNFSNRNSLESFFVFFSSSITVTVSWFQNLMFD